MGNALTWTVDQYLLLGVTLALFALVGLRRGVNRELLSMVGIGVGILVSERGAVVLQPQVNRLYQMVRFALSGGLSSPDPTAAWAQASSLPPLVSTAAHLQTLALCVFVLIVLIFYLLGQRLLRKSNSIIIRFLGMLAGGINGYLTASFIFPTLLNGAPAVITVPSQAVTTTLSTPRNIAFVIVFFIVVMIVFGLYNAGSSKKK